MSAKIISFADHRANVTDPILMQVEAYWDGLRNGRAVPSRAEVDPRGLSDILPHCFILERVGGGFARFRVYGRHVADLMDAELRELPISAVFAASDRDTVTDVMAQVFDRPAAARLVVESAPGILRKPIVSYISLLPLRDDLGAVSRVLGCVSVQGDITKGGRPLTIAAKSLREISEGVGFVPETRLASRIPAPKDVEADETQNVVQLPLNAD